jgi:DNA modification methylase
MRILNCDCLEYLNTTFCPYQMIFADPPDNIGLGYGAYKDEVPATQYYLMLESILSRAMQRSRVIWLSYYWRHDLEIKHRVRSLLYRSAWQAKTFIWRFTFGQHSKSDCGSGFRYLLRLSHPVWKPNVSGIKVPSVRQAIGDKRAAPGGRVPDDFWEYDADPIWDEFPRVVGNAKERREWHPTQHPEGLMERIIRLSTTSTNDRILDCFNGTGTTLRVAKRLGYHHATGIEIDPVYALRAADEMGIGVDDFGWDESAP